MKLSIATCQFPVSADIAKNYKYISKQAKDAKNKGAGVVHFCECALSGYAGMDFKSYKDYDWDKLKFYTEKVLELAKELKVWIILGSTHPLSGNHKPHNSLYVINDNGKIIDRYDKMFCSGNKDSNINDLSHYTSGDHFTTFTIKGIKCGSLICHDYRYPELYREYKKKGIQLMFHPYHTGGTTSKVYNEMQAAVGEFARMSEGTTIPAITMPATMRSYAASNYMYISCPTSSRRESAWGSFFVRPDGVVIGKLKRNVAGMLITEVDTSKEFYDSTVHWRDRAMNGIYHSGDLVKDKRSDNRTEL